MTFTEQNTVENYIRDLLVPLGWKFIPQNELPRQVSEVMVEEYVKDSLIRLNPTIKKVFVV